MTDLRVYEDDLDRLDALANHRPRWSRWFYRWRIRRLRREVAVLRDHQIESFMERTAERGDGAA